VKKLNNSEYYALTAMVLAIAAFIAAFIDYARRKNSVLPASSKHSRHRWLKQIYTCWEENASLLIPRIMPSPYMP